MVSIRVSSSQPASGFLWPTVEDLTLGIAAPAVDPVFADGFESP